MNNDLLDDNQATSIRFYYDLRTLRNITLFSISLGIALFLTRIVFICVVWSLIDSVQRGSEVNKFMWFAEAVDMLERTSLVVLYLGLIPFFMWLYRAYFNLENVNLKGLSVTAGWAVGWFFIPFANFFYYDVVILNDLLRGTRHLSTGNAPSKTIDGIPVPPVGLFFVIAWLFAGVIDRIAKQQILSGNIPSFTSGVILEGVSDLLYIVTGCLVFYVVFWVSKKHNEIYQGESIL